MGKIIRGTALSNSVKYVFVEGTDITNEAIRRHDIWPSAASVLGKVMMIGLMMGGNLKDDAALTIKIDGGGPIGQVVCDCNGYQTVRGYVKEPHVNFTRQGKLDELTTLGNNGFIDVIKDLRIGELFTSSVAIQTGDLAYDFAYYFNTSEQTPTAICLGSIFNPDNTCEVCGGILIQLLPDANDEVITKLEERINNIKDFSNILKDNKDNFDNILKLFFDDDYLVLSNKGATFYCPCDKKRFSNALLTLDEKDLQEMIDDDKGAEITCHYCGNVYNYTTDELKKILKEKIKQKESAQ